MLLLLLVAALYYVNYRAWDISDRAWRVVECCVGHSTTSTDTRKSPKYISKHTSLPGASCSSTPESLLLLLLLERSFIAE